METMAYFDYKDRAVTGSSVWMMASGFLEAAHLYDQDISEELDAEGRLVRKNSVIAALGTALEVTYSYDQYGNKARVLMTMTGTSESDSDEKETTTISDEVIENQYDAGGRLIGMTATTIHAESDKSIAITTLTYDGESGIRSSGTTVNAQGELLKKSTYDGSLERPLREESFDSEGNSEGAQLTTYVTFGNVLTVEIPATQNGPSGFKSYNDYSCWEDGARDVKEGNAI